MERGKIIVVANQKGGVAKTSTVRNLSYALAEMGKKVLVVDFDPQYNLTTSFGVLPTQTPCNTGTLITNLLLDESLPDTNEFIQKIGSVDLIPSSRSLTVAEANLLMTPDSNDYLAALLNPLRLSYDYIIVDTNPSLGSLTINALTAADEVIIPIDPELFALTGLQALVDTIKKIKRKLNPSIEIGGILFTKCNKRTNLYRRTYGQVTKAFQSLPIFNCQIPYTVKVGDANSYGMSVMELEQANPASLAYTYIPWNGLAFLLDAMIEDGDYPNPVVEEQPDPIGDYNIPDEVDEMGGPHRQMTIGEADFDYVLDSVAYEAGETVVEPVKPQAIVQMENDTPAAGDEPASVPDENPPVVVEAPETALPTDTAEQPTPPPVKGNTTAHKNFRRFQELFPEIVSGQYEYLQLEAGEAYYPLVIHHKYGSHYCMEHYYTAAKWMKAYTEKGYACAVHVPHLNDFNTDLVEMRKGRSVEDLDRQRMAELETAFEQSAEEEPEQGMEV